MHDIDPFIEIHDIKMRLNNYDNIAHSFPQCKNISFLKQTFTSCANILIACYSSVYREQLC